ncbi:unnamed protein product [Rotaria magnacalcarata]|uniref:Uncharacterized protein n=2 Tax=Rotaria magnacalcarata TaxID=392030 RepID=A0A816TT62_9BILA|nr:unnamed protein product [Rotaria magnacalcarata]
MISSSQQFINCSFDKFVEAMKPIIMQYKIEENESLVSVLHECYKDLTQRNSTDANGIQKLIGDLIEAITDNKIGDENEKSAIVFGFCGKIGIKFQELENVIVQHSTVIVDLKKDNAELKAAIVDLTDSANIKECFNYSNDLAKLFIFYYITPLLKKKHEYKNNFYSWTLFNNRLSVIKREVKNSIKCQKDLEDFIRPLQQELDASNIDILAIYMI